MNRFAALGLALVLGTWGCGASAFRVVIKEGTGDFTAGQPIEPRPGSAHLVYLSGGKLVSINRASGLRDHLLQQDDSAIIDLAFKSEEQLYVLRRDGVHVYYGARLFPAGELRVSNDAHLAAGESGVWVSTTESGQGRILRLDAASRKFIPVARFDRPIAALAVAPRGCYFATADSVYRLHLNANGTADLIFILALPDSKPSSIAVDVDHRILYVATETETWFYREGKVRPFHPLGGRIRCDGGRLFISSRAKGILVEIANAHLQAESLAD